MEDLADDKYQHVLDHHEKQSLNSCNSAGLLEDDDDSIVFGNSVTDLKAASSTSAGVRAHNGDSVSETGTMSFSVDQSILTTDLSEDCVKAVAYALSGHKIDHYVRERANEYEVGFSLVVNFI